MLSDERKKKLGEAMHKIHDAMSEAISEAGLSNEERHIVLCAVVTDIQHETIKYLEQDLD